MEQLSLLQLDHTTCLIYLIEKTDVLWRHPLLIPLHQLEDQVEGLGFGKAFDIHRNFHPDLPKNQALIENLLLIDLEAQSISL